ncbi:AP-2 complex subunit mu [Mortierella claussenii]|nr:AP-2 complex subunit mu [Mortierella claussenii]
MPRHPLQSLDQQQQLQLQDQQEQLSQRPASQDDSSPVPRPVSLSLSRFSRDCTASVLFRLRDSNPNTLAPWNSIYIPKHYRIPSAGQRQSSPGECDLVLKIFPRLALPNADSESYSSQDVISPCERCKIKRRDTFQIVGPDPAAPSPQRLFFSNGEIRLFFKICCPPSHHANMDENSGYIITFQLHHGKRILMSETVKNAGPGMVPESVVLDTLPTLSRPVKRKLSSSPPSFDSTEPMDQDDNTYMPRKRSTVMSLMNLVSEDATALADKTESPFTTAAAVDPSSPTTAVVPLSPSSFQNENDESRSRNKSLSYDDQTSSSWTSSKGSRSGSERAEEIQMKTASATVSINAAKHAKKRQEPHELSELGIGQRASANLHAAYMNGQLRERSKAGLPVDGLAEGTTKSKSSSNKPKPSHACQEPDCDKSFSRLFNLRSHMRTHSKARPFVCESCNFAFSRRHDRDRHAKKHLSEKPYKCIICEATFVRQDALVRHLRMDGVQNQCMAAMEQRSMGLNGDNDGGYMMAAKQQAHDEQQQEDREGADDKQKDASSRRQNKEAASQEGMSHYNDENLDDGEPGDEEEDDEEDDEEGSYAAEELERKEKEAAKTAKATERTQSIEKAKATDRTKNAYTDASSKEVGSKADGGKRIGITKGDSVPDKKSQASRAPSPQQERPAGPDAGLLEKAAGYEAGKQAPYAMTPRYEKGPGHHEYYGEDRYGSMHAPHPRSFYPSPSRSHSRSHSQSQPYPMGPDYHPSNYHESTPSAYPPPPHAYHGPQSKYPPHGPLGHPYRDLQPSYGYPSAPPSSLPRHHDRPPTHEGRPYALYGDQLSADPYTPPYPPRDPAFERLAEGPVPGSQPWVNGTEMPADISELEPDKSIFEAAMGLLRIRASQWLKELESVLMSEPSNLSASVQEREQTQGASVQTERRDVQSITSTDPPTTTAVETGASIDSGLPKNKDVQSNQEEMAASTAATEPALDAQKNPFWKPRPPPMMGPDGKPLSKNAMKKMLKQQQFLERKPQMRAQEKLKRKQKNKERHEAIEAGLIAPPPKRHKSDQVQTGITIGIDMSFDEMMRSSNTVEIDDCQFHQCVKLGKFDSDRTISFIPPDGEFELMRYRTSDNINLPFKVHPVVTEIGKSKIEYRIVIKANFSSKLNANNVVLKIPTPLNTAGVICSASAGKAKYVPGDNSIVWKITRFQGQSELMLTAEADLTAMTHKKAWSRPPISMDFQVLMFTSSGLLVRFLKVFEKSNYQSVKWVRYMTKAGNYQIRF